jgi:hypothetical protein
LQRSDDGFRKRIQGHVSGEESLQHRAKEKQSRAVKSVFIEEQGDLQSAGKTNRPGNINPADIRFGPD